MGSLTHSAGGAFRDPLKEADHGPGPTLDWDLTGSGPRSGQDYDLFIIYIIIIYIIIYIIPSIITPDLASVAASLVPDASKKGMHFCTSHAFSTKQI